MCKSPSEDTMVLWCQRCRGHVMYLLTICGLWVINRFSREHMAIHLREPRKKWHAKNLILLTFIIL